MVTLVLVFRLLSAERRSKCSSTNTKKYTSRLKPKLRYFLLATCFIIIILNAYFTIYRCLDFYDKDANNYIVSMTIGTVVSIFIIQPMLVVYFL
jgi:hypothetical protein